LLKYILSALCVAVGSLSAAAKDPAVVTFGIVDSIVADLSDDKRKFLISDFTMLVKDFTSIDSTVMVGGDALSGGEQLEKGQWHFGIFQGVEFARAQAKYPTLRPLMVSTYKQAKLHALLVAKKDGKETGFADFKGKNVGMLDRREHCRLFTDKGAMGKTDTFFGKLTKSANAEETLDDVLRGKADAAIVDGAALKIYEEIHPGRFAKLKVLVKSEQFPEGVIAYHQGTLSDALLGKLRNGMLKANSSEKGREVMGNFRITSFEMVPADYQQTLSNILKAYP
jgi:ABC-type phosphate/phosphonate transport system substrate-binding protein